MIEHWPEKLRKAVGGGFPNTYMCVDTEFTDSSEDGLLLEFGYAVVRNNNVVSKRSWVVNWYAESSTCCHELDYRLHRMRDFIPGWRFSPRYLKAAGKPPAVVIPAVAKLLTSWAEQGNLFVLQNGIRADENVIKHALVGRGLPVFEFPENQYIDTGGLFLAERVWFSKDPTLSRYKPGILPHSSETLKGYFKRLTNMRIKGLSWKLSHIIETYGVGLPEGEEAWHTAAYDALCLHQIMQVLSKSTSER